MNPRDAHVNSLNIPFSLCQFVQDLPLVGAKRISDQILSGPLLWAKVTTDACEKGWGAHYENSQVQEGCKFQALGVVFNVLENWASLLALTMFSSCGSLLCSK